MKFKKLKLISSALLYKKLILEGSKLITLNNENCSAILGKHFFKIVELVIHRDKKVTNKLRVFFRFVKYLVYLDNKHGALFAVKYLKASLLSIQRAIAGSPMKSLREIEPDLPLPRLCKAGLPRWIGTRDRRAILAGSKSVIQFYLSLFSLHRVLSAPVKAKLSTITDEFSGHSAFLMESLGFFEKFKNLIRCPFRMESADLLFLESSSPSNLISWKSWGRDAMVIRCIPSLYSHFCKWLELTGNTHLLRILKHSLKKGIRLEKEVGPKDLLDLAGNTLAPLGRLAFKEEAAGKLRIFAMVDVWTQSIFKPLHDALFKILKSIPNDATFDQDAAFQRAILKSKKSGHCYGFDLSAATDRLPIDLQEAILRGFMGRHLAALWRLILVDRDYYIPSNDYGIDVFSVRYSVGQPMGALSSWAMLALTHHAIVQYAWTLLGKSGWCEEYEVLGDDIVIFNSALSKKYVELMDLYGVPLNMGKSVISHGEYPVVEFAKRTAYKGSDVSPISLKMFLNQDTFQGKIAIFDWVRKRFDKRFVFSNLKTIMKTVRWDDRPLKSNLVILGVFSTLVAKKQIPFVWMLRHWTQTSSILSKVRFSSFQSLKLVKTWKLELKISLGWYHNILKRVFWDLPLEPVRPRALFSSEESRRWYQILILDRIYSTAKFALEIDMVRFSNEILLESKLLTYIDYGFFLVLRRRYFASQFVLRLIQADIDRLTSIFYDNRLLTLDVDELLIELEKVMTSVSIFSIAKKSSKKPKVSDNLRILQLFDKLLNSGFKRKINNQRKFEILRDFVPQYGRPDLNDRELITPHFNFIREYLPFDQTVFIQNLIVRKTHSWHWELASCAFTKLVRRKFGFDRWLERYPEFYW